MPGAKAAKIKATLKSKDGKKIKLKANIAYTIDKGAKAISGVGQFKFGKVTLKKFKGKFTPWHGSGFRLSKLSLVKPGESATISVVIPRLAKGSYTKADKASIQLIHVPMVNGKISTNIYRCGTCEVKVDLAKKKVRMIIKGNLISADGKKMPVNGAFAGAIE